MLIMRVITWCGNIDITWCLINVTLDLIENDRTSEQFLL